MSKSIVLLAAAMAAGVVSAQTSVASLFLLGFDDQDLVGSVMTADATMTQYFVTCAEGTDSSDCGAGPGVTVTMEPNTYGFNMDGGSGFTMSDRCVVESGSGVCTISVGGDEANDAGVVTTSLDGVETEDFLMAVTITAGLEKIAAATATGASDSAATSTAAPGDSASTTSAPTGTQTGASASAATETSDVQTGAAPHVTQQAIFVGVAALAGGMLAL